MKRLATLILALTTVSAAAAAQGPSPTITDVPQRKSYAPGNVSMTGLALGLATSVKINGVNVPIVRVTATRLVVGPVDPQPPGFGSIELKYPSGVVPATIEFLPTLKAQKRGPRLNITMNNGEPGTYILRYSYRPLFTPLEDQGIYGTRFLPTSANPLRAGVFADSEPLTMRGIPMPIDLNILGIPLRLQAECFAQSTGVTAYSNMAQVPGYGTNPGGG